MRFILSLGLCFGVTFGLLQTANATLPPTATPDQPVFSETTALGEEVTCFKNSYQSRAWNYCIAKTVGSTNPDVLFEFHGIGEDEHAWINGNRDYLIREAWHTQHLQAPTVVSVSFGNVWLLAEKNAKPASGLFEIFRDVVYPKIWQKLGPIHGQKILLGASMGGFNGSQIYLKLPHLFDRYVLICPIIADVSPFSPQAAIQKYISSSGASPFRVYVMLNVARTYFSDEKSYDTAYPLQLAQKVLNASYPPVYLSCSYEDPYGIFKSVVAFKNLAASRGIQVGWRATHGPHCTIDDNEVARVLATGHE